MVCGYKQEMTGDEEDMVDFHTGIMADFVTIVFGHLRSGMRSERGHKEDNCDTDRMEDDEPVARPVSLGSGPSKQERFQLKFLLNNHVLVPLWEHPHSWPFHAPVDVQKLNLHDYKKIIKNPMDLGTIKKKVKNGRYMSANECIEDFKTMFQNYFKYNRPEDDVTLMAIELEKLFCLKVAEMKPEDKPLHQRVVKSRAADRANDHQNALHAGNYIFLFPVL